MTPLAQTTWEWFRESEGSFFWIQGVLALATLTHLLVCLDLIGGRFVLGDGWFRIGRLRRAIRDLRPNGDAGALSELTARPSAWLGRAVRVGLDAARDGADREQVARRVGSVCEDAEIWADRRLSLLALFAQANLLVGLLGTVFGLVQTFLVISQTDEAPPPRELASGVSQALLTTIVGLSLAIPTLFAYTYLRGRADRLLYRLENAAEDLLDRFPVSPEPQHRKPAHAPKAEPTRAPPPPA